MGGVGSGRPAPRPVPSRRGDFRMPRRIGFSTYSETFAGGDYTPEEWEFIRAVAAYQKRWNRRYPSWREVFHIALALGYRKVAPPTDATANCTAGSLLNTSELNAIVSVPLRFSG